MLIVFILLYFIFLCFIYTLVETCSFQLREKQNGSASGEWGGGEKLGEVEGGKTVVTFHFIRKESLFN